MTVTDAELVARLIRDMDDCERCPLLGPPDAGELPVDALLAAMNDHTANHTHRSHGLPTAAQILDRARADLAGARDRLSEAAAWLRSDWTPAGSALTGPQAHARRTGFNKIVAATAAIDAALRAIDQATP